MLLLLLLLILLLMLLMMLLDLSSRLEAGLVRLVGLRRLGLVGRWYLWRLRGRLLREDVRLRLGIDQEDCRWLVSHL